MDARGALRLTKHHGAGNDFLVLLDPDDRRPLSASEARALCDRRRGIGADGVLRAVSGRGQAALSMKLRNADGGVAEMSGNGIRCLVQAAVDGGLVGAGTVVVQTLGGLRAGGVPARSRGGSRLWTGGHGPGPSSAPSSAPRRSARRAGVSTSTWATRTSCCSAQKRSDDTVRTLGPRWERSVAGGANVEFVWPGPGPGELTLRVWERGAGETLACGTGACAVVAAAHAHGEAGTRVRVHNPGGPLDVELGQSGISLAGPTQKVGDVTVDEAVLAALVETIDADPDAVSDAGAGSALRGATPDAVPTEVAARQ